MIGGLKNAVEHGNSLESAKRSFVNAGYSAEEVEAAAKDISGINAFEGDKSNTSVKPLPQNMPFEEKKFFTKKRFLIFSLILLIFVVGALLLGLAFA